MATRPVLTVPLTATVCNKFYHRSRFGLKPSSLQPSHALKGARKSARSASLAVSQSVDYAPPGISPHPDALRRRHQAELRKQQREGGLGSPPARFSDVAISSNVIIAEDLVTAQEGLDRLLDSERLLVIFYGAPWCAGCRSMYTKFSQIVANNPDVNFLKVSLEDDNIRHWAQVELKVAKLPWFQLWRGGHILSAFSANVTKVSMLRAEIAAHKECLDPHILSN